MGPGQDFNMDDYVFHSGGDPDFFYLGEEPNFTTGFQEVPLDPQSNLTEDINSDIMAQEVPLGPFCIFNEEPQEGPWAAHATLGQEPNLNASSQELFTPPTDYPPFMGGIMGMNVNFPTYAGQGAMPAPMPALPMQALPMPAPDTFQQRNGLPTPPMTQGASSTRPTPLEQATTPPPAEAPKQRNNPGPRGYKRSGKACTRCRKNKLRCDDSPQGCSNCAAAGCTCMASTTSGEVPRMHAHNTDNLVEVLHKHMVALEAYIQAHGGVVPERPDELKQW